MSAVERFERWMRLRGLSPNTIVQRVECLDRMIRAVGVEEPGLVTERHLADWQEGWRLAPQSHCTYVSHVQAFYRWAVEAGEVERDPSTRMIRPKLPRRLPRPIPEDRLLVALEAAGGRVRAYLFLAAFAGLRAAEIAGLRREDIREGGGQPVIVVTGKGRKERVLPLAPVLLAELRLYGLAPAGFVFGRFGDPARAVSPATVSSMSNEYLHGLGFTETLHTLRHRFASRCYQLSLDLRLVQEMLGHSSPTTTAGYAAFAPDAASAVVARLDGPRRLRAVST